MFYFDLAGYLGMTVKRMLEELDSVEISKWRARDRLSPLDATKRIELALGIVASLIHNANWNKPEPASHFMVDWGKEWREQPAEVTPEVKADRIDAFFKVVSKSFEGK